ncbi:MAG TPA: type I 3-dehydroquinate dehydratase [Candidatus Thermoplasmatota archaeon]|nr:type I 3-dehydroquinate dehydratase [Candidatus Thermoplasmatota archaeon]
MTRLVTSLLAKDADHAVALARTAPTDLVEIRLDTLPAIPDLRALRRALEKPAIATLRPARSGGRFEGTEDARRDALFSAIDGGFEFVDVEHDAGFVMEAAAKAAQARSRLVVSRHDPACASADEILAFLREASGLGVAKYAAPVASAADHAALIEASLAARDLDLAYAVMAVNDAALRLLAPALGMALSYAAHPDGPEAAPGQLPAPRALKLVPKISPRRPTGAARWFALLGDPVAHSLSPALHAAAFERLGLDAQYVALRVPEGGLDAAVTGLRSLGAAGFNVTTPHKRAIVPLLESLAAEARFAGAVNTVVADQGRLIGHNTDGRGAVAALREASVAIKGTRALVLGAGATATAVGLALRQAGAVVTVAARDEAKREALAKQLSCRAVPWDEGTLAKVVTESGLVFHATPVGRDGTATPLPGVAFSPEQVVFEANYGAISALVARARTDGATVLTGKDLLLHQGAIAFELFTGRKPPLTAMRAALGGA